MKITLNSALNQLDATQVQLFAKMMEHGTMSVEIYKPIETDHQTPHQQDELYVIMNGSGEFVNNGARSIFNPGDVLFVPAGVAHRFENFTDDFVTWVIFYGPAGGEKQ
jgi:mannose-6-phosphate isomerase-like protein (cupin superfamily)